MVALRFPDVAALLIADLEVLVGADHTGYEAPDNLADLLPFIRVRCIGGSSDRINNYPTVTIDAFDLRYADLVPLSEAIRDRVVGPPPAVTQIDRCECRPGPRELPWGDGPIRRWGATYLMETRRRAL